MAEFKVTSDRDGSRSFGEHDDRWSRGGGGGGPSRYSRGRGNYRGSNNRRYQGSSYGGRKSYGNRGGYSSRRNTSNQYRGRGGGRQGGPDPRTRLDDNDGDEVMGGDEDNSGNKRFSPYGRPTKGGYRGSSKHYDRSNNSGGTFQRLGLPIDSKGNDSNWFKVTIPWGIKADKNFILQSINSYANEPVIPTHFHHEDKAAVFYVTGKQAADAIRSTTKRVTLPNGYKMIVIVKPSHPPKLPMGEEEINKLKVCMSENYDPTTKSLNLKSLHTDKGLSGNNLYMALVRTPVMSNVVKIIEENIPELVCLDMSDNKLNTLEHLGVLVSKTPDIRSLNLKNNKLYHIDNLRKISGWKLECLQLEGNSLCDKFNDQTTAIRKLFPKVTKLDGHDLPPPITFDIEARTDLPKSKDNFFPNKESQAPIVKFLKDYFLVYDSDDRVGLAGAYHDQATFSLSTAYNGTVQNKQNSLSNYIEESRNLIRGSTKDTGRKHKQLKKGNRIIPQLCLLPKTVHDPNSFVVDVNFVSSTFMSFSVQGVFKEVGSKSDRAIIRAFSRTFITVPGGSSMQIVNDLLTITNASQDQVQSAFKNPAPTPSSSPVPHTTPTHPFEGAGLTEIQKQMLVSFMGVSHMNSEWSAKCLVENNWDYAKAGQIFMDLQQQGKIPPEAFSK